MFREKPVIGSLAVLVLYLLLNWATGSLTSLLPESTLTELIKEIVAVIWPLALVIFFGYGWVYKKKGFGKTTRINLLLYIIETLMLAVSVLDLFTKNDSSAFNPLPLILVRIFSYFGVGFREESVFRGIMTNGIGKKYGKDPKGV